MHGGTVVLDCKSKLRRRLHGFPTPPIASLPACWETMFSSDGTRAYESTCIEVRPRQYNAHLGVVGLSDGVRRVRFYACTIVAMRLAFAGRYRMVRMDADAL